MKKRSIILLAISILLMIAMLITTIFVDRSIRSKEAAILATATAYVPTGTTPSTEPTQPKTTPAPDFSVTGTDKKTHTLAELKGKPVVLCFWNIASAGELERMQQLQESYGDRAHIVAIHMTTATETQAKAQSALKGKNYTFTVFFDTTGKTVTDYQIAETPTTYFMTADGGLTARAKGAINPDVLPKALKSIGLN